MVKTHGQIIPKVQWDKVSRATVICDASFCDKTRAGGWAVWININYPDGGFKRIQEHGRFKTRPRSSTHAEQLACQCGLFRARGAGATHVLVQTDCLELVQSEGRSNSDKSAKEFFEARDRYWPGITVTWRHVKGHTGGKDPKGGKDNRRFYVNEWCDEHAKIHMRAWRDELKAGKVDEPETGRSKALQMGGDGFRKWALRDGDLR